MRGHDEVLEDKTYGLLSLDAVGLGGHLDVLAGLLVDGRHFEAWRQVSTIAIALQLVHNLL